MPKYEVLKKNKVSVSAAGMTVVEPPTIDFKIEVDIDKKIFDEAKADPLLRKKFADQAQTILDQTQKSVQNRCKVFDKLFQGMIDKGEDIKVVKKNLAGLNKALQDDYKVAIVAAKMGVQSVWDALVATHKAWKKFKIKIAVSIIGTLAGIGAGIAALVTSPFTGGVGGAVAILGFIKAGVTLAQDIKKIAIGIDAAKKEFLGHLTVIEKTAKSKGLYAGNEVSGAIFQEFLGISQPTIKSCDECFSTLQAKHAQLIVNNHKLSKNLQKAYDEHKNFRKDFEAEAKKRLKKHPTSRKDAELKKIMKQLDSEIKASQAKIKSGWDDCLAMYDSNKKMAGEIGKLGKRVKAIQIKDPKGLKVFREGLKFAALGLAPIDGNGIATKSGDLALGIGSTVGSYAYDKIASKALDGTVFDAA